MQPITLSQKLQNYISLVEEKTGRKVFIQLVKELDTPGMRGSFVANSDNILVRIAEGIDKRSLEQTIAHEVTHGLVSYGYGFPVFIANASATQTQIQNIRFLFSMIEDIIVNHIIFEYGFEPYAPGYLNTVSEEIKAANKGRDYYSSFTDIDIKNKFKVFRYILAWGFSQYFELDEDAKKILSKFERAFRFSFPNQFIMARKIVEILQTHNIFTSEGYVEAVKECAKLWDVEDVIAIETE